MGRENDEEPETSSLLVRNLSFRTSQNNLRDVFAEVGKVRDVYLPLDYVTRQPRGFAFVEFYSYDDAREAVEELSGKNIDGREIAVVVAQQRRKKPEEMRGRDGNKDPRGRPPGWRGGDRRGGGYGRDYSPSPYRGRSYSPRRRSSRERGGGRYRHHSPSPYSRQRSHSRSKSPPRRRSPSGSLSPRRDRGRSPTPTPPQQRHRSSKKSNSPSRSYSRSRSRGRADYEKKRSHHGHDGGHSWSSG